MNSFLENTRRTYEVYQLRRQIKKGKLLMSAFFILFIPKIGQNIFLRYTKNTVLNRSGARNHIFYESWSTYGEKLGKKISGFTFLKFRLFAILTRIFSKISEYWICPQKHFFLIAIKLDKV